MKEDRIAYLEDVGEIDKHIHIAWNIAVRHEVFNNNIKEIRKLLDKVKEILKKEFKEL